MTISGAEQTACTAGINKYKIVKKKEIKL